MNISEFTRRTGKFLSADEIARYETDYEPAYMAAEGIDKDCFCAMLKSVEVRMLVKSMSRALAEKDRLKGEIYREWKCAVAERDAEAEAKAGLLKALALVSATCDRATVATAAETTAWIPVKADGAM